MIRVCLLPLCLSFGAAFPFFVQPAFSQLPPNPQIDYPGFEQLTHKLAPVRARRMLSFAEFQAMTTKKNATILDARSSTAFVQGHIAGAINLPLTDFTAEALAEALPDRNRPILIYCNNNFSNNKRPVTLKAVTVALNIQTFINLAAYGYHTVYELGQVVDFDDPKVGWVKG
jgi:phage shock protein E